MSLATSALPRALPSPAIRLADDRDAAAIAAIYAPSVATHTSFEAVAPDADEMRARVRAVAPHAPWLVCTAGDVVVGYAYAARHRERAAYAWSVDVSVYLDAAYHGRRIGTALYTSLFALLRLQGFYTAHAGVALPNPASVRLHESLGFRPVGVYPAVGHKLGAWHDVGWWYLPLRAYDASPAPPRDVADLVGDPAWDAALGAGLARLSAP